jgi:glycerol-3-phosphate acyltransferase PlsY
MVAVLSAPTTAIQLSTTLFPMLLGFALLVLWKHRENIARLRAGTEPSVGKARV